MKLALIASSGGHLAELHALAEFWQPEPHFWVSFKTTDAEYLLRDEKVHWAYHPTNRSPVNLARNAVLAVQILRDERPDVVISTGAGVGVPFLLAGRALGMKTLYIESITRISKLSISGRLVYPFVDRFWVQWEELAKQHGKAEFHGRVV